MSDEKEKVVNHVTLENGEVVDFGAKGKCFLSYDIEAGTVTAKTVTGKVIVVKVADLSDSIKESLVYWGLARRLSSSILTTDAPDVATKIENEVSKLLSGKFASRGMGGSAVELDDFQVAWALVNATGVVNTGNGNFAVPADFLLEQLHPEWVDINNPKVIEDVLAAWNALSAKDKSTTRRNNTFVKMQEQFISSGSVEV